MLHRTISGRIAYTSRKAGREGEERGREAFTITIHNDGSRVMRALCEIEEPAPTVLRDVTCSFGPDDMPTDAFVRLMLGDSFLGAGLFRVVDGGVECESFGPGIGRVSQRFILAGAFEGLGMHPISTDAFMLKQMDRNKGPHGRVVRFIVPSSDHRGAGPPLIGEASMRLDYLGHEAVAVPAGNFAASHFRLSDPDDLAHPEYDIWVTADEDAIFLKGGVGGYMQTWYELVELTPR